jgi:hypothetical protein
MSGGKLRNVLWRHLVAVHIAGAGAQPQPQLPERGVRHVSALVRPCVMIRRRRRLRGRLAAAS